MGCVLNFEANIYFVFFALALREKKWEMRAITSGPFF